MTNITIEGLTKSFDGKRVLDSIDLTIDDGELVCLLGPSGCGKSTLLRSVAGLETPENGRISFGDKVVFDSERGINEPPERRRLSMVFQSFALWPHRSVFDNVAYPLRRQRVPKKEIAERVASTLNMVGLADRGNVYPSTLSGGQQQRVALARAVVARPKVLLFDEPLSSLDTNLRRQLRAEIRQFQRLLGVTSLFVTHDREESGGLADRVVVLQDGHVVQQGLPPTVFAEPDTPFVAEFGGFDNYIGGSVKTVFENSTDIVLDSGRTLTVPGQHIVDSRISLGMRSRLLAIVPEGDAPSVEAVMEGTIEQLSDLGDEFDVVVRENGVTIFARIPPAHSEHLSVGSRVRVLAKHREVIVFPRPPARSLLTAAPVPHTT